MYKEKQDILDEIEYWLLVAYDACRSNDTDMVHGTSSRVIKLCKELADIERYERMEGTSRGDFTSSPSFPNVGKKAEQ